MPPPDPASAPQIIFPFASVSRTEAPLQLSTVPILIPPPDTVRPPANVLVAAFVCRMFPPVMVSPEEEPSPAEDIPPAKVEVAVEEELSPPEAIRSPLNSEA
jgi:hypothetical protein